MLFVLLIYKYNLGPHQYNSHVVLFECGGTMLKEYVILAGRAPRLGRGSLFILVLVEYVVGDVLGAERDVLACLAGKHAPCVLDREVRAHPAPPHQLAAMLAHEGALPRPRLGRSPP